MLGRVVGRFRIVAKLGEGGMGSVWKAEDPRLGRAVALKFLPHNLVSSDDARRRFLRGAKAAAALRHPSIATVYEADEVDGEIVIACECVEGETVAELMAHGPLAIDRALRIAAEVAEALDHAHRHGILHRDIASRNIMVTPEELAVLIDFGLALDLKGTTTSGDLVGTLPYMAPEMAHGHPAGPRSEIYSLGAVLYEMLTGRPPFTGDTVGAIVHAAARDRLIPPSERRVGLGAEVDRVVVRALARDPADRHPDAGEFARALRALLPGREGAAAVGGRTPAAATGSTTSAKRPRRSTSRPTPHSLLVLPLREAMGATEPAADGGGLGLALAESLAAALARSPDLRVIPPSQVEYRPEADVASLARALHATAVLEGSIRRVGQRIRITYGVREVRKHVQLAADVVDGGADDLIALEDALIASVTRHFRIEIPARPNTVRPDQAASSHGRYLKALGFLQRGDNEASVEGGIRLLEEIIASEGDSAVVHAALGRAYLRKAELSKDASWKQRAEASCRRALALDPHSPEVLVTLGRMLHQSGRNAEAIETFERALQLRAGDFDALISLSRALEGCGRFADAETAAQRAIDARPEHWLGYSRLGMTFFRQGRFAEAEPLMRRVIELSPDNTIGYANLAPTLFELGRFDEARRAYERAIQVMPTAGAYIGLGTVHFFTGRPGEAVRAFESAIAIAPTDARAWANLADAQRWVAGQAAESLRSFDRAITLFREELASDPGLPEAWAWLAMCLGKRGGLSESRDALQRALALAPQNATCLTIAVIVHELNGGREQALEYFARAISSGRGRIELERDPELEDLRRDPTARAVLERSGRRQHDERGAVPNQEDRHAH